jgi:hypothetical protein
MITQCCVFPYLQLWPLRRPHSTLLRRSFPRQAAKALSSGAKHPRPRELAQLVAVEARQHCAQHLATSRQSPAFPRASTSQCLAAQRARALLCRACFTRRGAQTGARTTDRILGRQHAPASLSIKAPLAQAPQLPPHQALGASLTQWEIPRRSTFRLSAAQLRAPSRTPLQPA